MKRFTVDDITRIRELAECGYPATAIAVKLGREPLAIRTKMVALGIPLRRVGKPRFGARIKIEDEIWPDLNQAASALHMKPTRLANMLIRTAVRDKIVGAIIDAPPPSRKPAPPPPKRHRTPPPQLLAP
jgi:hypothetical protein